MEKDTYTEIVKYAYMNVPYYKNNGFNWDLVKQEDLNAYWEKIPIMDKDTLRRAGENLVSQEYKDSLANNNVIIKRTSGSTGKCLNIYWSLKDDVLTNLEAWRWRKKWYNVSISDKYATFHATLYGANRFIDDRLYILKNNNNISFNKTLLNASNIHEYIYQMKDYNVSVILTQPSVLKVILDNIKPQDLIVLQQMKYIELIGEYLFNSQLEEFKNKLPNVQIANMYGTTETGYIALTCPYGNMHILNNSYVEILDDDNNESLGSYREGKVILTSRRNKAMPIIRYDIGDKGYTYKLDCPCGCSGKSIKLTLGRNCDTIILPDGSERPCYILWYPVEKINAEFEDCIRQYHFYQENNSKIVVFLYVNEKYIGWRGAIEKRLNDSLRECVDSKMSFEIVYTTDNFFTIHNKLNFFSRKDKHYD